MFDEITGIADCGSAYVFRVTGTTWILETRLLPNDPVRHGWFGQSVAFQGDVAIVGAPGAFQLGQPNGAVYVFEKSGSSWTQSDQLLPTSGAPEDLFGCSVSIWNDKLVVGSQGCDEATVGAGAGWLYGRAGATWVELASLVAPEPVCNMQLGFSAAIEGSLFAIGSPYDTDAQIKVGSIQVWSTDSSPEHAAFCFGVGCPCANDDPNAGCANASGHGALLSAHGSLSFTENDLVLAASGLPRGEFGILVVASAQTSVLFGDGLRCIDADGPGGSGYHFFGPPRLTGPRGVLEVGPDAFQGIPGVLEGSTCYFQVWYRERQGPCGTSCNLSNALAITFTP